MALNQVASLSFNFVYCDKLGRNLTNISPLDIFNQTANLGVWILLLISLLSISLVLRNQLIKSTCSSFLLALSPLASPGISESHRCFHHSKLLTMWTLICLVLLSYFSGKITNVLISPPKEWRMTMITQVNAANYTILQGASKSSDSFLKSAVNLLNGSLNEEDSVIKNMFEIHISEKDEQQFYHKIATSDKYVYVGSHNHILLVFSQASEYLKRKKISARRCYIGEKFILPQATFLAVSPGNTYIARAMQVLKEGGYEYLWWKEVQGLSAAARVQDRNKMLSPTKFVEELPPPMKLTMADGKLKNVFVLWITCLIICVLIFIVEVTKILKACAKMLNTFRMCLLVFYVAKKYAN